MAYLDDMSDEEMAKEKKPSGKALLLLAMVLCALVVGAYWTGTHAFEDHQIEITPQGLPGHTGTRISPHGRVRPSVAASTVVVPVHYFNPNTGTESDYECEIELDSDGKVERINWPTGGWLEATDCTDNGDGTQTITTDRGYEYTIDLNGLDEPEDQTEDEPSD